MPETLKTHPGPELSTPKLPELTADTRIEDLSTGEIDLILEELEKDFQEPLGDKPEHKKGSVEHERNYNLTQDVTANIDYLFAHSKKDVLAFDGITITRRVGENNLSQERKRGGEEIADAREYKISRAVNLGGGNIRTDTAQLQLADSYVNVGFFNKTQGSGSVRGRNRGWGGAVWQSDAPLINPRYKNHPEDERKTAERLKWINEKVAKQAELVRVKQSRTVGQKLLHMWIGG